MHHNTPFLGFKNVNFSGEGHIQPHSSAAPTSNYFRHRCPSLVVCLAVTVLMMCVSDLAAEQNDSRLSDWRWSRSVLTLHHLRCEHDHEESVARGVHPRRGHALSRRHQPLHQAAGAVWRAPTEVGRRRVKIPRAVHTAFCI